MAVCTGTAKARRGLPLHLSRLCPQDARRSCPIASVSSAVRVRRLSAQGRKFGPGAR
jgi:hypothetical protein